MFLCYYVVKNGKTVQSELNHFEIHITSKNNNI